MLSSKPMIDLLVEGHPGYPEGTSSIPGVGTWLGCVLDPWLGTCRRQLIDVMFLSLSPSSLPLLSILSKIN